MKKFCHILFFSLFVTFFTASSTFGQDLFELALRKKMDSLIASSGPEKERFPFVPNNSIQSIMTPSGFGGNGSYLYGVIGGVYPALYTQKADLIGALGFCLGNSEKFVNFAASLNITRVKVFKDFSLNLSVSRRIFKSSSVSLGALQLFADQVISDSPSGTYYLAFSHAVQTVPSKTPGFSALTYTIGIGNGRFLHKSPYDIASGKGKYGTGVFANVSYEILKNININAEWSGLNLGISAGVRPFNTPLSLGFGVYNLTDFSGDKPSMIASMGYPISLQKSSFYTKRVAR